MAGLWDTQPEGDKAEKDSFAGIREQRGSLRESEDSGIAKEDRTACFEASY